MLPLPRGERVSRRRFLERAGLAAGAVALGVTRPVLRAEVAERWPGGRVVVSVGAAGGPLRAVLEVRRRGGEEAPVDERPLAVGQKRCTLYLDLPRPVLVVGEYDARVRLMRRDGELVAVSAWQPAFAMGGGPWLG